MRGLATYGVSIGAVARGALAGLFVGLSAHCRAVRPSRRGGRPAAARPRQGATACLAVLGLATVMMLGACTNRDDQVLFDGNHYPTRETGIDPEDRNLFEVTVQRVDQGLDGAVAAGIHGGRFYCIHNFGTSRIEWLSETDPALIAPAGNQIALQGRCTTW